MPLGDVLYVGNSQRAAATEDDWAQLVRSVGAGDPQALLRLYERAHAIVFTLGYRITRDRDIAEALTVETFLDVRSQAPRYDAACGPVLAWIMSIARARAIDRTREPTATPAIAEQRRFLWLVFSVLTFAERRTVEAAFFGGCSYDELAISLNESPVAVRSRLRIALQKLRRVLAEESGTQ